MWFQQRAGHITASKLKEILHTDFSQPSMSLIKGICYPAAHQFSSLPCLYGLENEDRARSDYFDMYSMQHESLIIIKIKCPYSCRIKEAASEDPAFCLEQEGDGSLNLRRSHSYFYQTQMQMQLCQVKYCNFVVWRVGELFHQRIELDEDFVDDAFHRAESFIKLAILPELVGKWFSKQNAMASCPSQDQDSNSASPVYMLSFNGWSYCGKDETFDTMIGCDSKDCKIQWYHLSYLKLTKDEIPRDKWFCPDCHKRKHNARASKSKI